jgi:DNA-binding HxlR family transcriptional regulator
MRKSYGQTCPLSRALDLLGERWTLLVVRELLTGPKRYGALLAALPGLGTNLLAARLRRLEAAGLLRPCERGYELTSAGRALSPAIVELARWGLAHAEEVPETRGPAASPLTLQALFDPGRADFDRLCCELRVEGQVFHVVAGPSSLAVAAGGATAPDAVLTLGAEAYRRLENGLSPRRLLAEGALRIEGSLAAFERLRRCFRRPAESPDAALSDPAGGRPGTVE